ncbi:MAG: tetratricopeptide (TPR) repeat protein [Ascidiaceihabitans sp.]|jgi:tetratricopeptide (TPR) repeat protein
MKSNLWRASCAALLVIGTAACSPGGISASEDGLFAPGVDHSAQAVNSLDVGHRLIAAGEHELALKAFTRAALAQGMNGEILSGMGSANLGLGRLGQAEALLRRATTEYEPTPQDWNNLGVILMERGKTEEAILIFRKAFALDSGKTTQIRDNLRLALAKSENTTYTGPQNNNYKLVRRGSSDYLISPTS